MAVGIGHRRAPEIVGGHADQRTGAQHIGVGGDGRYVVVHEIATQPVPVAHGDGRGHRGVHAERDVRPRVFLRAADEPRRTPPAASLTLVMMLILLLLLLLLLLMLLLLLLEVVVVVVMLLMITVRR